MKLPVSFRCGSFFMLTVLLSYSTKRRSTYGMLPHVFQFNEHVTWPTFQTSSVPRKSRFSPSSPAMIYTKRSLPSNWKGPRRHQESKLIYQRFDACRTGEPVSPCILRRCDPHLEDPSRGHERSRNLLDSRGGGPRATPRWSRGEHTDSSTLGFGEGT